MAEACGGGQNTLEALGTEYSAYVDTLYAQLMDLNVTTASIRPHIAAMLNLREEMIKVSASLGMVPLGSAAGAAGMVSFGTGAAPAGSCMGAAPQDSGVADHSMPMLTSGMQGLPATGGEEMGSVVPAEQAAPADKRRRPFSGARPAPANYSAPGGYRQQEAKTRLNNCLQILTGRTLTLGDAVYKTEALGATPEDSTFLCTLMIPCYGDMLVQGQVMPTRLKAEQNAAEAALNLLSDVLGEAQDLAAERKMLKRRRYQEQREQRSRALGGRHAEGGEFGGKKGWKGKGKGFQYG